MKFFSSRNRYSSKLLIRLDQAKYCKKTHISIKDNWVFSQRKYREITRFKRLRDLIGLNNRENTTLKINQKQKMTQRNTKI